MFYYLVVLEKNKVYKMIKILINLGILKKIFDSLIQISNTIDIQYYKKRLFLKITSIENIQVEYILDRLNFKILFNNDQILDETIIESYKASIDIFDLKGVLSVWDKLKNKSTVILLFENGKLNIKFNDFEFDNPVISEDLVLCNFKPENNERVVPNNLLKNTNNNYDGNITNSNSFFDVFDEEEEINDDTSRFKSVSSSGIEMSEDFKDFKKYILLEISDCNIILDFLNRFKKEDECSLLINHNKDSKVLQISLFCKNNKFSSKMNLLNKLICYDFTDNNFEGNIVVNFANFVSVFKSIKKIKEKSSVKFMVNILNNNRVCELRLFFKSFISCNYILTSGISYESIL